MASSDEETELLESFARSNVGPSSQERTFYFFVSLATVCVPIYLYITIFDLNLDDYLPIFLVVSIGSAYIMSLAYRNTAFSLKNRLVNTRDSQVSVRSISQETGTKGDAARNLAQKKRGEIINNSSRESTAFAIFYNNSFFLLSTVVLAFYIFGSTPAPVNYVLSVSLSSALLSLSSSPQV